MTHNNWKKKGFVPVALLFDVTRDVLPYGHLGGNSNERLSEDHGVPNP